MQIPPWMIVAAAVVLALPFGWGLGVPAAYVIAGKNFGQLPAATVPLGIIAAVVFALWPRFSPSIRLKTAFVGSVVSFVIARLLP